MSDAPERIVPSCVEALENYQQADLEGVMVLASRQAIHETIAAYWARVETCEELEAKLEKAVADLQEIDRAIMETVNDRDIIKVSFFFNQMSNIRAIVAELKGENATS